MACSTSTVSPRRRSAAPVSWLAVAALLAAAGPLGAWDATGHRVVARIAWGAMQPVTRERAMALLELDPAHVSLHAYWDSILTLCHPRRPGETGAAYVGRLAAAVTAVHPAAVLAPRLDLSHFEAWANDGYDLVKTRVYAAGLKRGEEPSAAYRDLAAGIAEPAIALAGYRLAALLDHLLAAAAAGQPQ
jgi:hypothetical protein